MQLFEMPISCDEDEAMVSCNDGMKRISWRKIPRSRNLPDLATLLLCRDDAHQDMLKRLHHAIDFCARIVHFQLSDENVSDDERFSADKNYAKQPKSEVTKGLIGSAFSVFVKVYPE